MLGWEDNRKLTELLPPKEARAITKAFSYTTAKELLMHYPRTYATHGQGVALTQVSDGDIVTCVGEITYITTKVTGNGRTLVTAMICTPNELVKATFFQGWVANILGAGTQAIFTGKVKTYRGEPQLQHPDFIVLNSRKATSTGGLKQLETYSDTHDITRLLAVMDSIPIYPAKSKMPTWRILGAVHEILRNTPPIADPLGRFAPLDLPSFDQAIRGIHQDGGHAYPYRNRLRYDEALALALVMETRRHDATARQADALPVQPGGLREQLCDNLPYTLTAGQQEVIHTIATDLVSNHPMQRLLQGEVGSGKTVVSLIAMLQAVDNGKQCSLLAPTSVLAHQHGRSLKDLLESANINLEVVVLTSSMPTAAKRKALLKIVSGDANIIIGTHALIQETVEFFDLGLCVVDEQHRFGVEQRDTLRGKGTAGRTPHLLVMTATPIPRTIAMTFFGDLNHSVLKELPGGRRPIKSYVVPECRPKYVSRAYEVMREHMAAGHQVYIVCPRINDAGGVLDTYEHLSETEFAGFTVGMLHGQMRDEEKDTIMGQFTRGEIQVLIATTVIEVGIDVPNATIMMVRESEHLGVSQLHQLRGRVGRGGNDSICFFHHQADPGTPAADRIDQMAATTNGFEVAEIDLLQRHEGDVLGTSQSGMNRKIKFLNLVRDITWIERTNADARTIVSQDIVLARHLIADIDDRTQDYLDKS